ncbi:hypothetical protein TNIN_297691 [Trichonephila inaurata madagascariensis]|uniref:Uncharacterized protein n=1 Tax=Trichonephila inaurata madagascariensis TaxID=2747483 RepID=A0A8X7C7N0_9ARAC|nr:hypothetical protein TNIN_297691 [Trichonephila inaurata madagascariensis]
MYGPFTVFFGAITVNFVGRTFVKPRGGPLLNPKSYEKCRQDVSTMSHAMLLDLDLYQAVSHTVFARFRALSCHSGKNSFFPISLLRTLCTCRNIRFRNSKLFVRFDCEV